MIYGRSKVLSTQLLSASALLLLFGCSSSTTPVAEPSPEVPVEEELPPPPPEEPVSAPVLMVDLDTVRAGQYDNGKMWTFEYPPLDYFEGAYGFAPDAGWFERARLGALRIPQCSASFVSPYGLVMTNHHCARESITQASRSGESLLDDGFYATSLSEERPLQDVHADQLIAILDVTDDVYAGVDSMVDEAAREERTAEIGERIADEYKSGEDSVVVEVIALWDGARYSAYVFRRYTDLRLVMAPHGKVAFFGGDPDNFTYPRYDLDMSFYRVYAENGEPLQTDYYFPWNANGVEDGDAVFVIGNPGSTSRLQTLSQLEYRRDVNDKMLVDLFASRAAALQAYYDADPEEGERLDLRNEILSLQNSQKATFGQWEGLHDPVIMAKRRDNERRFRAAIEADPTLKESYGSSLERMAEIQAEKASWAPEFGAFLALGNPSLDAAVLQRAWTAFLYLLQRRRGTPDEQLADLRDATLAVGDQPLGLQQVLLAARFEGFRRSLGDAHPVVTGILQGRTADAAAEAILAQSALADSASTAAGLEAGTLTLEDPAIAMVSSFAQEFYNWAITSEGLQEQESEVASQLGRAHFEVYGTTFPPDATFSLRIADGVVQGYEYNGTRAPAYTTFYGMYDRHHSFGAGSDWDLPEAWLQPPAAFDLSAPLNLVITADIIGGNSGSPVVNSELQAVGLIFDGNIESLPGDYIYDSRYNRAVAVDVRGMLEALDDVYDADRLVLELTTGTMARTEAEADASRR
jgi:hypothetical protein